MKKVHTVSSIKDPYSRRILSNILHKDPLKVYSGTPKILHRLTKGLSDKEMRKSTPERKWSIVEIVNHFCDAEIVMGYRYRKVLAEPGTAIQAYAEEKWATKLKYDHADVRAKLTLFIAFREDNAEMLRSLTASEWQRYGIHEERGKETVERMVQMMAGHDVNHLRQIETLRRTLLKARKK